MQNKVDILLISETKLDPSFQIAQFCIDGYTPPYRLDRNGNGGGIILYVREDIPSKVLTKMEHMDDTECFLVEINIRKRKWRIVCSYNPHKNTISQHLHSLSKRIDLHSSRYDNVLIIGDFNVESTDKCMGEFCNSYSLEHLVNPIQTGLFGAPRC